MNIAASINEDELVRVGMISKLSWLPVALNTVSQSVTNLLGRSTSILVSMILVSPYIFYTRAEFKTLRSMINLAYPSSGRDIILL